MTITNNPRVEEIRRRVRASYNELNQLLDGPIANVGTARIYQSPRSGERTIMENLAHIADLVPNHRSASHSAVCVSMPNHRLPQFETLESQVGSADEPNTKWYHDCHSLSEGTVRNHLSAAMQKVGHTIAWK